jgi:hypothetical protein
LHRQLLSDPAKVLRNWTAGARSKSVPFAQDFACFGISRRRSGQRAAMPPTPPGIAMAFTDW